MSERTTITLEPGLTFTVAPRRRIGATAREMGRKSRMSVWVQNESVAENFVARRNRPVDEWRKILQERVLPRFGFPTVGLRWNTNAYCPMCPCSPAFILPGWFGVEGPVRRNSWSTCDFGVTIDFALLGESSPSVLEPGDLAERAASVAEHIAQFTAIPGEILTP